MVLCLVLLVLPAAWADPPIAPDAPVAEPPPAVDASITGRILEFGSGDPIAATIRAGGASTTADAAGRFTLPVAAGEVTLTITSDEHHGLTTVERVGTGESLTLLLRLERVSYKDTIVVYGEQRREEVARSVWSADELRLVPGSFGDPIRALQSLPGVARPSSIEGAIVVRGSEGINTGTFYDEIPVPYLFHFFVGRSIVNPALLHDVEFYPGGMPSRFGDTTQAVVNARTLEHKAKPGLHGRVSADLLDFAASIEVNPKGGPWSLQGGYRASWIPQVASAGIRVYAGLKGLGGDRPGYPVLEYNDWLVRASYEKGADRFTFTALGATDTFRVVLPKSDTDGDGKPDDLFEFDPGLPYDPQTLLNTYFYRMQARWDRKANGHEQVTWIAGGPDRQSSLLEGIGQLADGVEFGELTGWYGVARRRDRFELGRTVLKAGADLWLNPVSVEDWSESDENGDPKRTDELRTSVAAWTEVQRTFGGTFVAPGLRIAGQGFQGRTRPQLEPRLSIRHPVADHWTSTAFVGRFSQIPPADRYADGIGNPDLDLITAWQSSFGLEGRWSSGLEIDATLYGSRSDGMVVEDTQIEVEPSADDLDAQGLPRTAVSKTVPYYHAVTGWAFGVEGMVRLRPSNAPYFGWLAVTIGRSLRVDDDSQIEPGDYDLPVAVSLVAAYELPKAWRVSGRIRATSGYPYTPVDGVFVPQWGGWTGQTGPNNSERFPWFRQLDLRVDKTWTRPRARWTLYADVFNTLNTRNWFLATYTANYAKLQKVIWIPILPTLGLEVKY